MYSITQRLSICRNFIFKASVVLTVIIILFSNGCAPKYQLAPLEPAEPALVTENGMVVAAHPLAAQAGVSVLQDGGNAVDAALATMFMLNVVEPNASGLGGGGFALVRMANGDAKVVNYREKAPREVDTSFYYNPGDTTHRRMQSGGSAVCVPGAPSGWAELHSRWGSLPLERLARDAIDAATNGFPVDPTLAGQIGSHYEQFLKDDLLKRTFLKVVDGFDPNDSLAVWVPYEVGDTLRQPMLGQTLSTLVSRGLRSFNRGPIAEAVVSACRADSGYMTLEDLEFYRAEVDDPITADYKGYQVVSIPPPSGGGLTLLESLKLFERVNATGNSPDNPEAIHMMSQCIQQGYADVDLMVGDPQVVRKNWKSILTDKYLQAASIGIDSKAKPTARKAVQPDTSEHGNTTHLVVVDKMGNVVSITQTINYFFGAGLMAGQTGILLNNQMADFNTPPDSMNLIQGGVRPRSNMAPTVILKDGKPFMIVGTPGGSRIPAAVAQIIVNAIDYNMDISTAIDYPRYFPVREFLVSENRFSKNTFKKLAKKGYQLRFAPPYHVYFGGAHGIMVKDGKMYGAADKRRGGVPRGY